MTWVFTRHCHNLIQLDVTWSTNPNIFIKKRRLLTTKLFGIKTNLTYSWPLDTDLFWSNTAEHGTTVISTQCSSSSRRHHPSILLVLNEVLLICLRQVLKKTDVLLIGFSTHWHQHVDDCHWHHWFITILGWLCWHPNLLQLHSLVWKSWRWCRHWRSTSGGGEEVLNCILDLFSLGNESTRHLEDLSVWIHF